MSNSRETSNKSSGCEIMNKLWEVAKQCHIDKPGIAGTTDRINNNVKCKNLRPFMELAALKCWQEKYEARREPGLFMPLSLLQKAQNFTEKDGAKNRTPKKS